MKGQWKGRYRGTNAGLAVVELDDEGDHLRGLAELFDDDQSRPWSLAFLNDVPKRGNFSCEVELAFVNPQTLKIISAQEAQTAAPGVAFPNKAMVAGEWTPNGLRISWTTSVDSRGIGFLRRGRVEYKSQYRPNGRINTWAKFKNHILTREPQRFIFRGQPLTARLRTTFHRTNRADLFRYTSQDIELVKRYVTARGGHIFDLSRAGESGALYSLIQHHGFPTPLLDWTYSPYIAAFFAFKNATPAASPDGKVRIFIFNNIAWRADYNQVDKISLVRPHFSIFDLMAIENNRMLPQQALSSLTNVEDVESYIRECEKIRKKTYLEVIDLPITERVTVMQDLSMMGITAGALMPGLDGTCEELKSRLFGF
ncbi:FRG domain-containing protein [Caulobacter sp. S45]|uniref:FRG domain-containing protein n=1 Tax=Caulobacter sp. S45 TaxID=1641861 RepID=UPI00131BB534|nr:FRG domain-containing protein [Caulobacter sp. S45]